MAGRPKKKAKAGYMISAVADLYKLHPQTLRLYERVGLLKPSRSQGNHDNLDKNDNRLSNLYYTTPRDNTRHALKAGAKKKSGRGLCVLAFGISAAFGDQKIHQPLHDVVVGMTYKRGGFPYLRDETHHHQGLDVVGER